MGSKFETLSAKKWAFLIILHVLGCVHTKLFILGPMMFPHVVSVSDLRWSAIILFGYLLAQYILVQFLIGGKKCGRRYHFKLLQLNLCLSISAMLTLPFFHFEADIAWIKVFIFVFEGSALLLLFISTAITLFRTHHLQNKRQSTLK